MFQHYILFRGRQPNDKPGYKTIDEKTEDGEKAPLLGEKGEESSIQGGGDCSAVSLSKKFKRLLRLA